MDASEATKIVMSRIQSLDPENASKIMGYILIQDQGEKDMIRLAFSPDALLLSYINHAKLRLGLPSNTLSSNPSTSAQIPMRPNYPSPKTSPKIMIPNNGFHLNRSPSSPAAPFQRSRPIPISYASVLDRSNITANNDSGSPSLHFYGGSIEFGDGFLSGGVHYHAQNELPFPDDSPAVDTIMSPSRNSDSLVFPYGDDGSSISSPHSHSFHRRSWSVNDAMFLDERSCGNGFLWRPCVYFARGFCKNGSSCKFLHSDVGAGVEATDIGSPSEIAGFDEMLKLKALQQQRLAFMASGGHNPFANKKCMNSLNENPRNDLSPMGLSAGASSSARQIYLTFPADSTFKEVDVSNYFSMFGPVQDVRIPYQQKRMFGFVTFVYPETVKLILENGNPHFVCDSRVLVKPYKEKGKVQEKKQQQHLDRGEYSAFLSPSGVDSRERFDHPFGPRMLLSAQEMMLRKRFEQEAELQHAIELQGQRMMSLQLRDTKNQHPNHHYLQIFPTGSPYSAPSPSQLLMNEHVTSSSHTTNKEYTEELDGGQAADVADEKLGLEAAQSSSNKNTDGGYQLNQADADDSDLHRSLEHILTDNLFASPTKSAAENQLILVQASAEADDSLPVVITSSNITQLASSSPIAMASLQSYYLQMPRLSSGQEAIEM